MKDIKSTFKFRVIIHTVQMLSENFDIDIEGLQIINQKKYIIRPSARICKNGCLFPINANKLYNREIDRLSDFLEAMQQIQRELGVTDWNFNRVDFTFDTPLKYDSIYKYSAYIISLFSASTGIKNAIDIQDINTKKKRALTLKSPALEIQIYDKALESNNRQPYTRVEIRLKNIRDADIYSLAERILTLIDSLSVVIKKVEKQKVNYLYQILGKERNLAHSSMQAQNFSEFVRRYNDDIFTRKIAMRLYSKIYNGNFNNWLKKFKRNNTIDFITDSEIQDIMNEMKIALNRYLA